MDAKDSSWVCKNLGIEGKENGENGFSFVFLGSSQVIFDVF
jgi:hypothetical protein